MGSRPERIILVCGTGTEVGKTWVGARLLGELRSRGLTVSARKPAQSFDIDGDGARLGGPTDAEVLGDAAGEHPDQVCHSYRSYHRAMAPPMAAEALGLRPFTVGDLVGELEWPAEPVAVGLVEMAGGVRSPQAVDGDTTDMIALLRPDLVVLVADAGLGTINGVRLSMAALHAGTPGGPAVPVPVVVVLDRFDGRHEIHCRNRQWLAERDALPGDHPARRGERPRRRRGRGRRLTATGPGTRGRPRRTGWYGPPMEPWGGSGGDHGHRPLEAVRHHPGRRRPELRGAPRRGDRLSRSQRLGQVDHHAHDHGPRPAEHRHGDHRRQALPRSPLAPPRGRRTARGEGAPPRSYRLPPPARHWPRPTRSPPHGSKRCSGSSASTTWPGGGSASSHSG